MIHSGSRAMGQAITQHHVSRAETRKPMASFDLESETGQAYLNDMSWGLKYAAHNRLRMAMAVEQLMTKLFNVEADWESWINCHHNHVLREEHFGVQLWIHRKGAQSAHAHQAGVIPGSMGTASFHVEGRGCPESLCSSSHGAGRRMSRSEARRSVSERQLHQQMGATRFDQRRSAALRDEAPAAYKDIYAVMRAQRALTKITNELRPLLSYKGT